VSHSAERGQSKNNSLKWQKGGNRSIYPGERMSKLFPGFKEVRVKVDYRQKFCSEVKKRENPLGGFS